MTGKGRVKVYACLVDLLRAIWLLELLFSASLLWVGPSFMCQCRCNQSWQQQAGHTFAESRVTVPHAGTHTHTQTHLSVHIQLSDTRAYPVHDTALIDGLPRGPLFVFLLCLQRSAGFRLPVATISCSLGAVICVMLALAQEKSLWWHSANQCQANRRTRCQPSQLIILALFLNTWTTADWSGRWLM